LATIIRRNFFLFGLFVILSFEIIACAASPILLYSADGSQTSSLTTLASGSDVVAQYFSIPGPDTFEQLQVHINTFAAAGRNCTMRLYEWNSSYSSTISGAVIAEKEFSDIPDDTWVLFYCGQQLPGEYLITISQATGGQVAVWAYDYSQISGSKPFSNGNEIALSTVATFTESGGHLAGALQGYGTVAQDFYGEGFDTVTFRVFTYLETADSFDMDLYQWQGDFSSSVASGSLASQHYVYGQAGDNEAVVWNLGSTFGAGYYLLVMSNAGGSHIGWWRYDDSSWMGSTHTAFTGGVRTGDDTETWLSPSKTVDMCIKVGNADNRADLDGDGTVNFGDVEWLSDKWLFDDCYYYDWCEGSDLTHDGLVGLEDFSYIVADWMDALVMPGAAVNLRPLDAHLTDPDNTILKWSAGSDASSYDVFLSPDSTITSGDFLTNTSALECSATTLSVGQTYYWRVDAKNSTGTAAGTVTNFIAGQGVSSPAFASSLGGDIDWAMNRMWDIYGLVIDGAVYKFGNEPPWFDWLALKLFWSNDTADKNILKNKLIGYPMNADGYVWSWTTSPTWPTHNSHHQVNNAKFISAVYRACAWLGSDILNLVDTTTAGGTDVSYGMTLLEKVRLAMQWQLDVNGLQGNGGLAIIANPVNDGTVYGLPTNYWDNLLTGYKSTYTNTYFYASLKAMAAIETEVGNTSGATTYENLAGQVKSNFNTTLWDSTDGRFVSCIDDESRVWDFGYTFIQTEAMFHDIVDISKVTTIYDWMDGNRIVSEDIVYVGGKWTGKTGSDIYHLGWAPVANTRAVESIIVSGKYWWYDIGGAITVGGSNPSASYGEHLENGGAIFYTSFFDVASRVKFLGADNGWARYQVILDEFLVDELRRDPPNNVGAAWKWGIIGEFPESGLVPTVVVHSFMGIDATIEELYIQPELPSQMDWLEVKAVVYKAATYRIKAWANNGGPVEELEISTSTAPGSPGHDFVIGGLHPNTAYTVTIDGFGQQETADPNGRISLSNISANDIAFIVGGV